MSLGSGSIGGSMEEEVATMMAGIQMLLRHTNVGLMKTAYSILCKVSVFLLCKIDFIMHFINF